MAWRIRFGSSGAAREFVAATERAKRPLQMERAGQEVLLTVTSAEELSEAWEVGAGCGQDKARTESAPPSYRVPRFVTRWRGRSLR